MEYHGEVTYSDLNFMLLGWALESCSGRRLRRLAREELLGPLGMRQTDFRPGRRLRHRTAATEADGDQRPAPGVVWGEVHDGNAWALGGVAGHAGLFAPLDDLAAFAGPLLRPESHPLLPARSIAEMGRQQAGRPPDVRGLGWRLQPEDWGGWPAATWWHTGFTGTSLPEVRPESPSGSLALMQPISRAPFPASGDPQASFCAPRCAYVEYAHSGARRLLGSGLPDRQISRPGFRPHLWCPRTVALRWSC